MADFDTIYIPIQFSFFDQMNIGFGEVYQTTHILDASRQSIENYLNSIVSPKADKTYVDGQISTLNTTVAGKEDKTVSTLLTPELAFTNGTRTIEVNLGTSNWKRIWISVGSVVELYNVKVYLKTSSSVATYRKLSLGQYSVSVIEKLTSPNPSTPYPGYRIIGTTHFDNHEPTMVGTVFTFSSATTLNTLVFESSVNFTTTPRIIVEV